MALAPEESRPASSGGGCNLLVFFDFPGLDGSPYAEVLGGLHHVCISVEPDCWRT